MSTPSANRSGEDDENPIYQTMDGEVAILGACLLEPESILECRPLVSAIDFVRPAHQLVWSAIVSLNDDGVAVDFVTVMNAMRKMGTLDRAGGKDYLAYLVDAVPAAGNVVHYALLVKEASRRRALRRIGREIVEVSGNDRVSVMDVANDMKKALENAVGPAQVHSFPVGEKLAEVLDEDVEALEFPVPGLEDVVHPLELGSQVVIGGQPGSGKTALILQALVGFARAGRKCALLSFEMRYPPVVRRLIAIVGGIPFEQTTRRTMRKENYPRLSKAGLELKKLPLRWVECGDAKPVDLLALARAEAVQGGVVALDYLQIAALRGSGRDRRDDVDLLSSGLKRLGQECGVVTLVVSQIRRQTAEAKRREPGLTDLKESSTIEQDADIVLFAHGLETPEYDEGRPRRRVKIIVAKNRNGPANFAEVLAMDGPTMTFQGRSEDQESN